MFVTTLSGGNRNWNSKVQEMVPEVNSLQAQGAVSDSGERWTPIPLLTDDACTSTLFDDHHIRRFDMNLFHEFSLRGRTFIGTFLKIVDSRIKLPLSPSRRRFGDTRALG